MKKNLLVYFSILFALNLSAQCNEIFISEHVEGYGNNRALELYNPSNKEIDLNLYSIGRFDNGSTTFQGFQIPAGNKIQPYKTFVVVLDKRDPAGTGLEIPIWDGYQKWGVCIDKVTGTPIIGTNGDTVYCVQYDTTGTPLKGTEYHDFLDLKGKADIYACPVYNLNKAMYFNGNDAVALIKGTQIEADGSNIIDVIGVIGVDPGADGWKDKDNKYITKDKTIVRKPEVKKGTGIVFRDLTFGTNDTSFNYNNWIVYGNNTFNKLRKHDCQCDPNYVGISEVITVPFKMYPNPSLTGNDLNIIAEEAVKAIKISNFLGQQVYNQELGFASNEFRLATNLKSGMYIVELQFANNQKSIKKWLIE